MPRQLPTLPTSELVLNPAARVLWRGTDAVQLELGAEGVIVEGIDPPTVAALVRRDRPGTETGEQARGERRSFERESLETLLDGGYVWAAPRTPAAHSAPITPRLASDLTALAVRRGRNAPRAIAVRRSRSVAILGSTRIAPHVAALLAASGVGRVYFADSGDVHLYQTMPGGLPPRAEGNRFAAAAAEVVRQTAPEADTAPAPMGTVPDLTVLAIDEPVDAERRDALHARGCVHLLVRLAAGAGVVGPLVVPGRTSCLRCADLHRRDRDPAWHALAVQLTVPPYRGAASDVCMATVVGGIAAAQSLALLDGESAATANGTLELHPPDWRVRRRTWPPHPACHCLD